MKTYLTTAPQHVLRLIPNYCILSLDQTIDLLNTRGIFESYIRHQGDARKLQQLLGIEIRASFTGNPPDIEENAEIILAVFVKEPNKYTVPFGNGFILFIVAIP